MSDII